MTEISPPNERILAVFGEIQKELDTKHDRAERLVKLSRDLTIQSKRIIFLLHRANKESREQVLDEAEKKFTFLKDAILTKIRDELVGQDWYQFKHTYSPGIQEFVEALSFYVYLKEGRLLHLGDVHERLSVEPDKEFFTHHDFILGLADLTGELMRFVISTVASGHVEKLRDICLILQQINQGFMLIGNQGTREVTRKMTTLRESVMKVERACYFLHIRGSEMPQHLFAGAFENADDEGIDLEES